MRSKKAAMMICLHYKRHAIKHISYFTSFELFQSFIHSRLQQCRSIVRRQAADLPFLSCWHTAECFPLLQTKKPKQSAGAIHLRFMNHISCDQLSYLHVLYSFPESTKWTLRQLSTDLILRVPISRSASILVCVSNQVDGRFRMRKPFVPYICWRAAKRISTQNNHTETERNLVAPTRGLAIKQFIALYWLSIYKVPRCQSMGHCALSGRRTGENTSMSSNTQAEWKEWLPTALDVPECHCCLKDCFPLLQKDFGKQCIVYSWLLFFPTLSFACTAFFRKKTNVVWCARLGMWWIRKKESSNLEELVLWQ